MRERNRWGGGGGGGGEEGGSMAGVLGAGRNRVRGRERRRKKQAGGKSMQEKGLRMRHLTFVWGKEEDKRKGMQGLEER